LNISSIFFSLECIATKECYVFGWERRGNLAVLSAGGVNMDVIEIESGFDLCDLIDMFCLLVNQNFMKSKLQFIT
jgi:hypothetical protein